MRLNKSSSRRVVIIIAAAVLILVVVAILVVRANREDSVTKQIRQDSGSTELADESGFRTTVLNTQDELETFNASNQDYSISLPEIDLAQQSILTVSYAAPSPGHSIVATLVDDRVNVVLTTPGENCIQPQVITNVYDAIAVGKDAGSVALGTVTEQRGADCPG